MTNIGPKDGHLQARVSINKGKEKSHGLKAGTWV
jgi:hypothetical protein